MDQDNQQMDQDNQQTDQDNQQMDQDNQQMNQDSEQMCYSLRYIVRTSVRKTHNRTYLIFLSHTFMFHFLSFLN